MGKISRSGGRYEILPVYEKHQESFSTKKAHVWNENMSKIEQNRLKKI